jgi:hypothetical protein
MLSVTENAGFKSNVKETAFQKGDRIHVAQNLMNTIMNLQVS